MGRRRAWELRDLLISNFGLRELFPQFWEKTLRAGEVAALVCLAVYEQDQRLVLLRWFVRDFVVRVCDAAHGTPLLGLAYMAPRQRCLHAPHCNEAGAHAVGHRRHEAQHLITGYIRCSS